MQREITIKASITFRWLAVAVFLLPLCIGCGERSAGRTGSSSSGSSQSPGPQGKWTWVGGSSALSQPSIYGTESVASSSNVPQGRYGAASWTDASGNFWLFGGYSTYSQGKLNDLWKYDPSTKEWTWMGGSKQANQAGVYGTMGVPSSGNYPGARMEAMTWVGKNGNFWLFGGVGVDGNGSKGTLDDLWKYDPATNEWTWMDGSKQAAFSETDSFSGAGVYGVKGIPAAQNFPGARQEGMTWVDSSGNLWLFGGNGAGVNGQIGDLDDLWKYNPATNEWTWVDGPDTNTGENGVYGTKGMASPSNIPGSRTDAATWTGISGNFWLFGGDGADAQDCQDSTPPCELNDLWKYNPSTNEWTWVGGPDKNNQPGVYGTEGVAATSSIPPSDDGALAWTDAQGNFWLFGGSSSSTDELNDLWEYDPSSNEWTWMSGGDTGCPAASYGQMGYSSSATPPPPRWGASGWIDNTGNLWIFGGSDDTCRGVGTMNDLWEYQP